MQKMQKHTGVFAYFHKNIDFHFWSNTKNGVPPDTIIFLGAGQVDRIARWVAKSAGCGVVVVEGLPHWEVDIELWDADMFCKGYVETAFNAVLDEFDLSSANIIAESQAAPATVALAHSVIGKVRNVVLIRPLGFTASAFGDTPAKRLRTFKRRMLASHFQFTQTPFHDPRNLLIKLLAMRAVAREPSISALSKKYADGVSYDLLDDCKHAADALHRAGYTFTLLLGARDVLFPPNEILAALANANIKNVDHVIMPKTSHASLGIRAGKTVLHQALSIIRT